MMIIVDDDNFFLDKRIQMKTFAIFSSNCYNSKEITEISKRCPDLFTIIVIVIFCKIGLSFRNFFRHKRLINNELINERVKNE